MCFSIHRCRGTQPVREKGVHSGPPPGTRRGIRMLLPRRWRSGPQNLSLLETTTRELTDATI